MHTHTTHSDPAIQATHEHQTREAARAAGRHANLLEAVYKLKQRMAPSERHTWHNKYSRLERLLVFRGCERAYEELDTAWWEEMDRMEEEREQEWSPL